ncbi:MAG: hypothetical protein Q9M91_03430 [Candidatus Dojkabacteria bacterium]|nr:hypothetical protein [Candidatus Dojkabacteria bacterium]MDQ7020875.1 hypothetical protein [Candidatus Dojkabacteria bacterium]
MDNNYEQGKSLDDFKSSIGSIVVNEAGNISRDLRQNLEEIEIHSEDDFRNIELTILEVLNKVDLIVKDHITKYADSFDVDKTDNQFTEIVIDSQLKARLSILDSILITYIKCDLNHFVNKYDFESLDLAVSPHETNYNKYVLGARMVLEDFFSQFHLNLNYKEKFLVSTLIQAKLTSHELLGDPINGSNDLDQILKAILTNLTSLAIAYTENVDFRYVLRLLNQDATYNEEQLFQLLMNRTPVLDNGSRGFNLDKFDQLRRGEKVTMTCSSKVSGNGSFRMI